MPYEEPDGYCQNCGIDLDADPGGDHDETHRMCWGCWRAENSPAPEPQLTVADRRFERLLERMHELERRVERLETVRAC